jgi:oxygen-independent coproporphyrinogen-3 oxidase
MSGERAKTTPLALADEPATGNYFVAAYPPFSCWSESATGAFEEVLARPADAGFGLYIHLPFCSERCDYCYYLSYENRGGAIDRYLEALRNELAIYAETPRFRGRGPRFVYFGGGTPSLLSAARIERLLGELRAIMPWSEVREATFECAPMTCTRQRLLALRDAGVTRISLGIQQLDDKVLRRNGRIHRVADVERGWAAIRRVGFEVVNVDLIVGLVDETDESIHRTLERVIEMAPESVTVYQLEIPENTPLFHALREGRLARPPASWDYKHARLEESLARLEAAGYTVRSAYTAVREPRRHRFLYQDDQYRGADLLGLGASAFSYLGGVHQQNAASLDAYLEALTERRLPLSRAYQLSADEQLVREFVLQLKLGAVDVAALGHKHGVDPCRRFADPLAELAARRWVELDGETVRLTRQGLVRADRLLPAFYLPQHRVERYS